MDTDGRELENKLDNKARQKTIIRPSLSAEEHKPGDTSKIMGPRLPTVLVEKEPHADEPNRGICKPFKALTRHIFSHTLLFESSDFESAAWNRKAALKICQGTGRPTKSAASAGAGAMLSIAHPRQQL